MRFERTPVRDVFLVLLEPHHDDRGLFVEGFVKFLFEGAGIRFDVRMANMAVSERKGAVRGMHWQATPFAQGKVVYAAAGRVFDAVVDVRPDSSTFGGRFGTELVPHKNALYAPPGVAHGWQALEDRSALLYLVDGDYKPSHERGIRHDDPDAAVPWPLTPRDVAPRDLGWPSLREVRADAAAGV